MKKTFFNFYYKMFAYTHARTCRMSPAISGEAGYIARLYPEEAHLHQVENFARRVLSRGVVRKNFVQLFGFIPCKVEE